MKKMIESKLVSKGPVIDRIKKETNGLNIANEIKLDIIDYFESLLSQEIKKLSSLAIDVTELQGKRTIQEKDWFFIQKILENK